MKKSVTTRIKITKNGKIMRRKMAQGHFRAGKTGNSIRQKRGSSTVATADEKNIKAFIYKI